MEFGAASVDDFAALVCSGLAAGAAWTGVDAESVEAAAGLMADVAVEVTDDVATELAADSVDDATAAPFGCGTANSVH